MEYRHKIKRSAVSFVIDKAIRDIRSDPRRSIRNLADLGDCFSKTPAQKKFFKMVRDVLKNPDNPYYKLLLSLVYNVDQDIIKTVGLNFGYTALNYGAEIIRKNEAVLKKRIPWLLCFDYNFQNKNDIDWTKGVISDAVSLGIYTFIFKTEDFEKCFEDVLKICKNYNECCFFAAISPKSLSKQQIEQVVKVKNLILSVNITDFEDEISVKHLLETLHDLKCFYGFHAYYTKENAKLLMSDEFTKQMINRGCIFGGYINKDINENELEKSVYSYVCSKRGKNGSPLFLFDFYSDASYISNTIFCARNLYISNKGEVKMAGGILANLHNVTFSELAKTSKLKFAD